MFVYAIYFFKNWLLCLPLGKETRFWGPQVEGNLLFTEYPLVYLNIMFVQQMNRDKQHFYYPPRNNSKAPFLKFIYKFFFCIYISYSLTKMFFLTFFNLGTYHIKKRKTDSFLSPFWGNRKKCLFSSLTVCLSWSDDPVLQPHQGPSSPTGACGFQSLSLHSHLLST